MTDMKPVRDDPGKEKPQITAPSHNRMIIAFPFSAVRISQADDAVAGLAAIVVDLAELVAKEAASPAADQLADRARDIAHQIEQSAS